MMIDRKRTIFTRSAFTLVEAVISVAVMGLLIVPAVQMVGVAAKARAVHTTQQQGLQLARELLTEIMESHYTLPTGMTDGTTRQTWILIDDYNGLSESPPMSQAGVALAGYTGWKRTAAVIFALPSIPTISGPFDLGLKAITVTVSPPTGPAIRLVGLRSSSGPYERKPSTSMTYTSWVDVTIDGGSGGKVYSGADLINEVP